MKRRRRKRFKLKYLNEGSLRKLWDLFVKYIARSCPWEVNEKDYLNVIFRVDQRTILRYTARKAFKMPGLFCAAPNVLIPGWGYKEIQPGDLMYVRHDVTMPNRWDVELIGNQKRWQLKDQVFRLTTDEWEGIEGKLKERKWEE